ncbi:Gnk2-homologous domain [Macleaya cordata]|uniref:Gnk2-homologous domain n=1 Tax=Macleaya cordata TaxID=56857 RepID=A0A200QE45_MACCD|nr:Gnk2-homologous domain [Macleaya cordata]
MALFLYHLTILLVVLHTCTAEDPSWNFCNINKNITSTHMSSNIDNLLAKLVSETSLNGFTSLSYGTGVDRVYGLAQCRGDVINSKECFSCIKDASTQIQQRCPNQADARIVFEYCFLRYDSHDFIGELDTSYGIIYYNVANVTDPNAFEKDLGALMDKITAEALVNTNGGFGKGKTKLSPLITLYALVQCTRDLSKLSCAQCLATAIGDFATVCQYKKGCRSIYSSCYARYELYPIFFPVGSRKTMDDTAYSRLLVYP